MSWGPILVEHYISKLEGPIPGVPPVHNLSIDRYEMPITLSPSFDI